MLGANTDPYQPIEKTHKVTRSMLEVLLRCKHPVSITTKGALVARDVDLLAQFARDGLARVMFSIPTLDNDMKRVLEPRAASAGAKLKAMRVLAEAGVPVGVLVAPIIPVLTEHEIEARARSQPRGGRVARRLHDAASALGSERSVPRMAGRAFPRPRGARHVDRAQHARRTRQRPRLRDAHARRPARWRSSSASDSSSPRGGSDLPRTAKSRCRRIFFGLRYVLTLSCRWICAL